MKAPRNFAIDHAGSLKHFHKPWYRAVTETMFGHGCMLTQVNDVARQKSGIDTVVIARTGRYFVDDKFRNEDHHDLLCETLSDRVHQRLGWMYAHGMRCDFLHYAILPARISHFVSYRSIRQAIASHPEWLTFARDSRHGFSCNCSQSTSGDSQWITDFFCIPMHVVREVIGCTTIYWDDALARQARAIDSEIDRLMGLERPSC
ncbi:hypothetical protein V3589_14955 [Sinorhizobium fredii]|uniref:hypothetical protein n=1 Tax=Rhizobium fredii TaxID=380 RepID=UPI0030A205A6